MNEQKRDEIISLMREMLDILTPVLLEKTYGLGLNALLLLVCKVMKTVSEELGCDISVIKSQVCNLINSYEKNDIEWFYNGKVPLQNKKWEEEKVT